MLKLVSLNTEGHKHLDRILPFLAKEQADIVCLQEVFQKDIHKLSSGLYPHHFFVPTWRVGQDQGKGFTKGNDLLGVAILSRHPTRLMLKKYYSTGFKIPRYQGPGKSSRALLMVSVSKNNIVYHVATTHFTWTKDGSTSPLQHTHLQALLKALHSVNHFCIAGDFNAPRGGQIHQKIASLYTDHTPKDIVTTVDPYLHYANQKKPNSLQTVVDYVFSTPEYSARVHAQNGLSDHLALIATIKKST